MTLLGSPAFANEARFLKHKTNHICEHADRAEQCEQLLDNDLWQHVLCGTRNHAIVFDDGVPVAFVTAPPCRVGLKWCASANVKNLKMLTITKCTMFGSFGNRFTFSLLRTVGVSSCAQMLFSWVTYASSSRSAYTTFDLRPVVAFSLNDFGGADKRVKPRMATR
jgi:hypothetical protein